MQRNPILITTVLSCLTFGPALAQDATIRYYTPTIEHGQPTPQAATVAVPKPVTEPVPLEAQAGAAAPVTPATPADLDYLGTPQLQTSERDANVQFVSGGIGAFEKEWFDANSPEFGLKATYADTNGHHLAGVQVTLADHTGQVLLNTVTEGPYLLVKAKPGSYSLTSVYEGVSQQKTVRIGGKTPARTTFTFKDLAS